MTTTAVRVRARGATVGAVLRSELIKIRSVRSTWVGLASLIGISVLITVFGGHELAGMVTPDVVAGLAVVGTVLGLSAALGSAGTEVIGSATLDLLWQAPLVAGLLAGFATALAVLVRNVWLAVGALATLQFVIGIVAATLLTWLLKVLPYLPFDLGHTVLNASQAGADLTGSPSAGLAIALLVAWTVAAAIAAAVVSRRRDGA